MSRTEPCELTVLCLLEKDGNVLLQDRAKKDWNGLTLPGGHVERGESFVQAVIREMQEESGLTILNPRLCGIKQFPIRDGRYLVFLFAASEYEGTLHSSEEGEMFWADLKTLDRTKCVKDFDLLIDMMKNPNQSEFQYLEQDECFIPVIY